MAKNYKKLELFSIICILFYCFFVRKITNNIGFESVSVEKNKYYFVCRFLICPWPLARRLTERYGQKLGKNRSKCRFERFFRYERTEQKLNLRRRMINLRRRTLKLRRRTLKLRRRFNFFESFFYPQRGGKDADFSVILSEMPSDKSDRVEGGSEGFHPSCLIEGDKLALGDYLVGQGAEVDAKTSHCLRGAQTPRWLKSRSSACLSCRSGALWLRRPVLCGHYSCLLLSLLS